MSENNLYPPKPALEKVKVESNWGLTVFTIILFIGVFLLVFSDQLLFILCLIAVLFIHEFGHFLAMKYFGYENVRMLFIPLMGAFVQGSKDKYSQRESFIVTMAGPMPGVIIGSILLYFAVDIKSEWLLTISFLFIFLNLMNLLPLDPLDGGQLFKLFAKKHRETFLLIFALLSSLILIVAGWFMSQWIIMGIGFFMAIRIRSMQRNIWLRKTMIENGINYEVTYEELSDRDYYLLKNILVEDVPILKQYTEQGGEIEDEVMAAHVNAVLISPVSRDASFFFKFSIVVAWILLWLLPIIVWVLGHINIEALDWYLENL